MPAKDLGVFGSSPLLKRDPAGTSKETPASGLAWILNPSVTPNLGCGEGMANRQDVRILGNHQGQLT